MGINYCQIKILKISNKLLTLCPSKFRYRIDEKHQYASRLVATVNHIDGNTLNNNSSNLEWVSPSENMYHSYKTNLNKKCREVVQYNNAEDLIFIEWYPSIAKASRETGESEHCIRSCVQGNQLSTCKYYWEFENNEGTYEYSRKYSHTYLKRKIKSCIINNTRCFQECLI